MSGPRFDDLSPGAIVEGPLLAEPVEVILVVPMGTSVKLSGNGLNTSKRVGFLGPAR